MVQTQPQDESDVKLLSAMKDYGGHVVGTAEDDDGPDYAFTAGMFQTHEALGICIVGLDEFQVMMQ